MPAPTPCFIRAALVAALALGASACPTARAQPTLAGRDLAAACVTCHANPAAADAFRPLGGTPADESMRVLADFRSGARPSTVMQQIARGFDDAQLRSIAAYFAAQPAPR